MVALIAPRRNRWVKKFEVTTCMSQIRIYFELIRSYIHVCISLSFSFFSVASPLVWLWRYKAASNNNKASSARLSFLHCAPPPPPPPPHLFFSVLRSSPRCYFTSTLYTISRSTLAVLLLSAVWVCSFLSLFIPSSIILSLLFSEFLVRDFTTFSHFGDAIFFSFPDVLLSF